MQRFRDLIFEDGRSEYNIASSYICAFRLLFRGFNFRGLPVNRENRENWIPRKFPATVFIRIVAAATINFAPSSVRLLIEGGSYSRAATIYFARA